MRWRAFLRGLGRPPGDHALLVWNNSDAAVAAAHRIDPDRWWIGFGEVVDRIAPRFARYEPLRHASRLMLGMLSGLDRKNCWTIAEARGCERMCVRHRRQSRAQCVGLRCPFGQRFGTVRCEHPARSRMRISFIAKECFGARRFVAKRQRP